MVGVDTAIFSPSAGSVGIGSAVASDLAKGVVQQLKDNGKVARSWLGVEMMTQDIADSLGLKDANGAIVGKVEKDLPAAAAGLKDGDVVASVNGESVADWHGFRPEDRRARAEEGRRARDHPQRLTADGQGNARAQPDDKQAQADADFEWLLLEGRDGQVGHDARAGRRGRRRGRDGSRRRRRRPRRARGAEGHPDRRRHPRGRRFLLSALTASIAAVTSEDAAPACPFPTEGAAGMAIAERRIGDERQSDKPKSRAYRSVTVTRALR